MRRMRTKEEERNGVDVTVPTPVALVSAPRTMPSLNTIPAMVVPVFTGFGALTPFCCNISFLQPNRSRDTQLTTETDRQTHT